MHTILLERFASRRKFYAVPLFLLVTFLIGSVAWCQSTKAAKPAAAQTPSPAGSSLPVTVDVPKDPLGRITPRGTVLGFLAAGAKGNNDVASQYLNTKQPPDVAAITAKQLFVVLDRRLPARLNELSDLPEGPPSDPLKPNQYLVGTIRDTEVKVYLERVGRTESPPIWLFSSATLEAIPGIYEQVDLVSPKDVLPPFLVNTQVAGIPLYAAISVLVGLPCIYLLTVLLSRLLGVPVGWVLRRWRRNPTLPNPQVLPQPIRLLIIAFVIRLILPRVELSLIARQVWFTISFLVGVAATTWLLIWLNGLTERYFKTRLEARNLAGVTSVQRLIRRAVDLLIIIASVFVTLNHFGIDITAALAGLGVGGIAIALAAQKTLENVIGGISIIFDHAVRVGDFMKIGETVGTVTDIGLRSLKIRTEDRTLVVIPNGQLANMSLEILSARDRYWFHPGLALQHDTSSEQISAVVDGVRAMLANNSRVDRGSVRVRFIRIGTMSLDIDVFAYVFAANWSGFLEIQEELLQDVMRIVQGCGARLALPAQTNYLATDPASSHTPAAAALQEVLNARHPSKPNASRKRAAASE